MGSSSVSCLSRPFLQFSSINNFILPGKPCSPPKFFHSKTKKTLTLSSTSSSHGVITKSVPLVASIAILLWSNSGTPYSIQNSSDSCCVFLYFLFKIQHNSIYTYVYIYIYYREKPEI